MAALVRLVELFIRSTVLLCRTGTEFCLGGRFVALVGQRADAEQQCCACDKISFHTLPNKIRLRLRSLISTALADCHQAGVTPRRRGVDAERALNVQTLQQQVGFPARKALHGNDGTASGRHLLT